MKVLKSTHLMFFYRFMLSLSLIVLISCGKGSDRISRIDVNSSSVEERSIETSSDFTVDSSKIKIKVFLSGFFDTGTGQLKTDLNDQSLLPTSHPYTDAAFNHSGSEEVSGSFFSANTEIVDWVLIEVRSDLASSTKVASKAVLIDEDGFLRDLDGSDSITISGVEDGEYYIILRHRNHLAVMSADKVLFSQNPGIVDFTSSLAAVLSCESGDNCMREVSTGIYGLWSGDINQDGRIVYDGTDSDRELMIDIVGASTLNNIVSGYYAHDLNNDGEVRYNGSSNDRVNLMMTIVNAFGFVMTHVIEGNENI